VFGVDNKNVCILDFSCKTWRIIFVFHFVTLMSKKNKNNLKEIFFL
jgi:hypothetical protein